MIYRCRPITGAELCQIIDKLEAAGILSWREQNGDPITLGLLSFDLFNGFKLKEISSSTELKKAVKILPNGTPNLSNFPFGPAWPELEEHYYGLSFEEMQGELTFQIRSSLHPEALLSAHIHHYQNLLRQISTLIQEVLTEKPILVRFKGRKGIELDL